MAALALALGPAAEAAADRWVREPDGSCRREWTAGSLARGPRAMLNGVLMPFRSLAGSFTAGVWGAVLMPASLFVGLWEGVAWTSTGAFETVSAGSVALAPEGATRRIAISPVVQFPLSRRQVDDYEVDLCEDAP